jgi:hypothetical protein
MMGSEQVVIVLAVIVLIWIFLSTQNSTHVYVTSTVDNKNYYVRDLLDKQTAADTLAEVSQRMDTLVKKLIEKYGSNDSRVNRLKDIYLNRTELSESKPLKGVTSYTINKKNMVLCVRARDNDNTIVDVNTILFVALHELAHIATISVGHTDDFWANFRWILAHATDMGIYDYVDYAKHRKRYCGIYITDSPFKLENLDKHLKLKNV